jgi:hypothetical protein
VEPGDDAGREPIAQTQRLVIVAEMIGEDRQRELLSAAAVAAPREAEPKQL